MQELKTEVCLPSHAGAHAAAVTATKRAKAQERCLCIAPQSRNPAAANRPGFAKR